MSRGWDGMIKKRDGIYRGRRSCPYCALFDKHAASCPLRALLAAVRAAEAMRLRSKPVGMSPADFWASPKLNQAPGGERLHRALVRLARASGGR